jgi:hypothetical protein
LVILGIGSYVFAWASLDHDLGMTSVHHHTQLLVEMGVSLTFCTGWPWTLILLISASWVAGITGMSHHAWSCNIFLNTGDLYGKISRISLQPSHQPCSRVTPPRHRASCLRRKGTAFLPPAPSCKEESGKWAGMDPGLKFRQFEEFPFRKKNAI